MRLYTVDEAQASLAEVVPVLESIRDAMARLRALRSAFDADARGAISDGHLGADPWDTTDNRDRLRALEQTVQAGIEALDARGIELKDADRGLIDFFHERAGQVVYLCYLLGEERIGFWHSLRDGFAGRQAI